MSMMPSTPVPSACTHLSFGEWRKTSSFIIGPKVMSTSAAAMNGGAFEWWSTTSIVSSGNFCASCAA
jgi:hypothetical protein